VEGIDDLGNEGWTLRAIVGGCDGGDGSCRDGVVDEHRRVGLGEEGTVLASAMDLVGCGFVRYGDAMEEASSISMCFCSLHMMIRGGCGRGFCGSRGGF